MIKRTLSSQLLNLAQHYPVVSLIGPRQSGKSTLCQMTFAEYPLFNLESPSLRERISSDPQAFIDSQRGGCIIDEIQYLPELLSYIQVAVDDRKRNGEFIITGSQQYQLMASVAQSLAGRTAIARLLPLSIEELTESANLEDSLDARMIKGSYPRVINEGLDPNQAYSFYAQTYLERDVRQIVNVQDLGTFERFLRLCAGRSGQLVNLTNLSNETGVDQSTIARWLTVLETSFIIVKIQPHFENLSKRVVKSPKLFFLDTGLLCYLLGISTVEQLSIHPLRGAIFETYVASEIIKYRFNRVLDHNLYFYRNSSGKEIDFLIELGNAVQPIEVKASRSFNKAFLKNIEYYLSLPKNRAIAPGIVYSGSEQFRVQSITITPVDMLSTILSGKGIMPNTKDKKIN